MIWIIKLVIPLSVIAAGAALLMYSQRSGSPPQLTPHQAQMIDSLKTAAPTHKELR